MNDNGKKVDLRNYRNRIIFGAPGTGKSKLLNEQSKLLDKKTESLKNDSNQTTPVNNSKRIEDFKLAAKKLCGVKDHCYEFIKLGFENPDIFYEICSESDGRVEKAKKLDINPESNASYITWGADLAKEKNNIPTKNKIERVTFHPNYSYAQFVGTYKPVSKTVKREENGKVIELNEISYEYVPGPFINTWIRAKKSRQPQLLIIEEINRANVAAVFGDTFQLLDRDSKGKSEYPITISNDLKRYLSEEEGINIDTMTIPENMYIWATMNSADQGVFPMDAAFKRRWDFEYLPIDEKNIEKHLDPKSIDIKDTIKKINEDTDLSEKEKKSCSDLLNWKVAGKKGTYNWYLLRKEINKLLKDKVDWINEDKLLGPWFIKPDEGNVISAAKFTSKVLMYLYEDVVKIDPKKIFKGGKKDSQLFYSEIANNWEDSGVAIFNFDGDNISSKIGYEGQQ